MKNSDVETYDFLYLRDGNSKNTLDYMKLLQLYSFYLSLFFEREDKDTNNNEESYFYMNLEFLSWVVNGFSYYHDKIFDKEEINVDDISTFSLEEYDQVLGRVQPDDECSICNMIFMKSWCCNFKMLEEGFVEPYLDVVQRLLGNTYKIKRVMSKEDEKEIDFNEVEYWKSGN